MRQKLVIDLPFAEGLTPELYVQLRPIIKDIEDHALERSQLNAPIHDGTFRDSMFVKASLEGKNLVFDFGADSPIEEIIRLHEAEYQLGEISKIQPGTVEGGVGNKFFTRVIDYWALTWTDWIIDGMLDILDASLADWRSE